jgi:hypothetical protein
MNNPEMSKFELGISWLLRLMVVQSTGTANASFLPSFAAPKQAQV